MKGKSRAKKPVKVKDLPATPRGARKVKGGATSDVCKTPAPGGPVAIPYPN